MVWRSIICDYIAWLDSNVDIAIAIGNGIGVVLYYIVLIFVILYRSVWNSILMWWVILYFILLRGNVMYFNIVYWYCIVLYCIVLYYIVLYFKLFNFIALRCMHCITLLDIMLYSIAFAWPQQRKMTPCQRRGCKSHYISFVWNLLECWTTCCALRSEQVRRHAYVCFETWFCFQTSVVKLFQLQAIVCPHIARTNWAPQHVCS